MNDMHTDFSLNLLRELVGTLGSKVLEQDIALLPQEKQDKVAVEALYSDKLEGPVEMVRC